MLIVRPRCLAIVAILTLAAHIASANADQSPDLTVWSVSFDAGVKARRQGRYAEAEKDLRGALELAEVLGPNDARVVHSLNELGTTLRLAAKVDEAKSAYERALKIAEAVDGTDSPDVAASLYGLAAVASHQDRAKDAEALFKSALAIRGRVAGEGDPALARELYGYATFKMDQQDFGEARTMLIRALAIYEKNVGDEPEYLSLTLSALGYNYEQQGKNADAASAYSRALAEGEKVLSDDHPALAWIRASIAEFKYNMQDIDGAAMLLEKAVPVLIAEEGANEQEIATYKAELAAAYMDQKKYVEAEHLYAEALPALETGLPKDDPMLVSAETNYGRLKTYNAGQASGSGAKYETRYVNGTSFQLATQGDLQVWVACWKGSEIQAMLYVVNGSDHPITFFPDQVKIESLRKDGRRSQLKTFTADQYETKVSNANAFKAFAIALGQSGQNQPQPQTTQVSGRYNVNAYGSGQSESGSYYGTITRWPTQADYAETEARNNARTQAMVSQLSSSFQAMSSTLMRTQTLDAHSYYGGVVYMNQSGTNYVMTIPFEANAFEFAFSFK